MVPGLPAPRRRPGRAKRGGRKNEPRGRPKQGDGNDAKLALSIEFQYDFIEFRFDKKRDAISTMKKPGECADIAPEATRVVGILKPEPPGDPQRYETYAHRHAMRESQHAPHESLTLQQRGETFRPGTGRGGRRFPPQIIRFGPLGGRPPLLLPTTGASGPGRGELEQSEQPSDRDPARACSPANDREGDRHGNGKKQQDGEQNGTRYDKDRLKGRSHGLSFFFRFGLDPAVQRGFHQVRHRVRGR